MKIKRRNKVSAAFNMSSMTDIVFLLLIFFLLSSPTVTPEALDLILPKAKGKTTEQPTVAVSIDKDLNIYINDQKVAKNQLETKLQERLSGQTNPTIILRTAQSVPIQAAVDVMAIAKQHQYKVVLAVRPR